MQRAVERGLEIISEASRGIADEQKSDALRGRGGSRATAAQGGARDADAEQEETPGAGFGDSGDRAGKLQTVPSVSKGMSEVPTA
jgi:hypothetical protein